MDGLARFHKRCRSKIGAPYHLDDRLLALYSGNLTLANIAFLILYTVLCMPACLPVCLSISVSIYVEVCILPVAFLFFGGYCVQDRGGCE